MRGQGLFSKNRPTRAERQVRNLSRGLLWSSIVLLAVTVSMTGRFGWNLGVTTSDRFLHAIGNSAIDIVGALIMAGCGVCVARRAYIAGTLAGIGACICILLSGFAIFGFLASNRSAVAKHLQKVEQTDASPLEWLRGQSIAKAKPAAQRETFFTGVKEHIREIKSAQPQLPDAQAEDLATMAGVTEEEIRRWLTVLGTGSILFCQFACLGLYGFIRQRIEPDVTEPERPTPNSAASDIEKALQKRRLAPLKPNAGLEDLLGLQADGVEIPSQKALAKRWRCSEATVSERLSRWEIPRERGAIGSRNKILAFHANGHAREGS